MTATEQDIERQRVEQRRRIRLGMAIALGSALAYAVGQVLSRKLVAEETEPAVATFYALLFGTLIILGTNGRNLRSSGPIPRRPLLFVCGAGLCSSAGVMGMFFALNHAPVVVVSPIFALNSLVAMTMSAVFLQTMERVTRRMIAGGVMVALGTALIAYGASQ